MILFLSNALAMFKSNLLAHSIAFSCLIFALLFLKTIGTSYKTLFIIMVVAVILPAASIALEIMNINSISEHVIRLCQAHDGDLYRKIRGYEVSMACKDKKISHASLGMELGESWYWNPSVQKFSP